MFLVEHPAPQYDPEMALPRSSADPRIDRSRRAALEGALALLLEEGWDAVTHLRVAERSGVGRTTLYRHWRDREALLHDTVLFYGVAENQPLSGDLRTDILTVVEVGRAYLATAEMPRLLTTLCERAACSGNPEFETLLDDMIEGYTTQLRALLTEARRSGGLRSDLDVEEGIVTLLAPLLWRCVIQRTVTTRKQVERAVDDYLEFNAARVRGRRP